MATQATVSGTIAKPGVVDKAAELQRLESLAAIKRAEIEAFKKQISELTNATTRDGILDRQVLEAKVRVAEGELTRIENEAKPIGEELVGERQRQQKQRELDDIDQMSAAAKADLEFVFAEVEKVVAHPRMQNALRILRELDQKRRVTDTSQIPPPAQRAMAGWRECDGVFARLQKLVMPGFLLRG